MLSIHALRYLANTNVFKDDQIKSFFEQDYFIQNKLSEFRRIVSIQFPDLRIPPDIFALIVEYEDNDTNLHKYYKCKIAPNLLSKCYSSSSLVLLKMLRITSNMMLLLSFAWYLSTWHHKQTALFHSIRKTFVDGRNIRNITPVPSNFDSPRVNLSFTDRLRRAYKSNPFDVTSPTIPLSKNLILPFSPKPNINISSKYWNNKYNLLAFVFIWYLFEALHNYIIHRCYKDFTQLTPYLNPKYLPQKCQQVESNIAARQQMSTSLKRLYRKWRYMLHNYHHEQFYVHLLHVHHHPVGETEMRYVPLQRYQFFLAGNCLAAVALLHTCTMPCSQFIGYIFRRFDFYNARYFFLTGNETWTRRLSYYAQSIAVYSFKTVSMWSSCAVAAALYITYPYKLGMSGIYRRYFVLPPATRNMICRNLIRHRYKAIVVKLMLLLSGLTYGNNFASLFGVFCYGLLLGESMEHWMDSKRQFERYRNYRMSNDAPRNRDVIHEQYAHRSITRLMPLIMDLSSSVLLYAMVGTPERLQLQAVGAYKSRRILTVMGVSALMLGLITHMGNVTYLDSGYYYNFPQSYGAKQQTTDEKETMVEYHPPPRDLFEWITFALLESERLGWSLYRKLFKQA